MGFCESLDPLHLISATTCRQMLCRSTGGAHGRELTKKVIPSPRLAGSVTAACPYVHHGRWCVLHLSPAKAMITHQLPVGRPSAMGDIPSPSSGWPRDQWSLRRVPTAPLYERKGLARQQASMSTHRREAPWVHNIRVAIESQRGARPGFRRRRQRRNFYADAQALIHPYTSKEIYMSLLES